MPDWICLHRPDNCKQLFMELLEGIAENNNEVTLVLEMIDKKRVDQIGRKEWKVTCEKLLEYVSSLADNSNDHSGELIFASAQQISSVLRTNLTSEVRSRLNIDWPEI